MTYEEGLAIAKEYYLEDEYNAFIADGFSPEEALQEWYLL